MSYQHSDVIIVGAGIHGLCAAHTFIRIDPSLKVLILDDKNTLGGVWAREQLYPGLRANNLQGYYEFSDFPILQAGLEEMSVRPRDILSGEAMYAYLCKYAEHFGLLDKLRLKTKVLSALCDAGEVEKAWRLKLAGGNDEVYEVSCSKLIVATGQASQPLMPEILGAEYFRMPVVHTAELGAKAPSLISDSSLHHITVLGGGKSAHDAVYMFASAGKRVTWITRRHGRGAMPMANPYTKMGSWMVWLEGLLMTRPLTWFGACPWSDGDGFGWVRWALHRTRLGRALVKGYFANMSRDSLDQSGILRDEKTRALVPDQSLIWYGTQVSSLNYDKDFYEVLRKEHVQIIREDLQKLNKETVILQNGEKIRTDVLICATGYNYIPSFALEPEDMRLKWGVPVPSSQDSLFPALDAEADKELFQRFPVLHDCPNIPECQPGSSPWRLWRFIAPPSQVTSGTRSLAFLSTVTSYQTTIKCELTSLWTYAYLHHALQAHPGIEADVLYEAALWSRFGKWRCPMGMQGKIADFFFDSMPYYDLMLRDLGLRSWRKGWGILGEIFGRWYEVGDYRGVVDEWIAKRQATPSNRGKKMA